MTVSPYVARLYKMVHSWTGIVAGLFLFVAFYAGAITVFAEPLARWASPPAKVAASSLDRADELIRLTLHARPLARNEFTLHLGETAAIPARLTWQKSREDTEPMAASLAPDGGIVVERLQPTGLARFIDELHRGGGLPLDGEDGATVMGVVSALYFLALVSGIVIVLPTFIRDLLALRVGPNLKRMWMDAHNLLGVVSLPFHVVMALTAVVFGLHDHLYDAMDRFVYEGRLSQVMRDNSPYAAIPKDRTRAVMLPPAELLDRVRALEPAFQPVTMQYRNANTRGAVVVVWGTDDRHMVRKKGFVVMSPITGEVYSADNLPGHRGNYAAVLSVLFALHFATFGGLTVKWAYVVMGLAGAFLFYSGNLLWLESRRRRLREEPADTPQVRQLYWLAALTVGVCMGCIAGVSASIGAAKWLHGLVANLELWHHRIYFLVFVVCVLWAFVRGAGRAAYELPFFAAVVTLAIPATTLVALYGPVGSGRVWGGDLLAVDGLAVVVGLGLIGIGRAAARRARSGPANSVWVHPSRLNENENFSQ